MFCRATYTLNAINIDRRQVCKSTLYTEIRKARTMSTKKEQIVTNSNGAAGDLNIKVYRRRWIVLTIFILYASVSAFQWIEYPIITNIVMRYYNVSAQAVDWTSIVYMALFAPLVVPASYVIDKKVGRKKLIEISVFGSNSISCWQEFLNHKWKALIWFESWIQV